MTVNRRLTVRRIRLAQQSAGDAPVALAAAARLAAAAHAELAGLFVENIELVRLAALPFTREVCLASGIVRPIDVQALERAFHADARRMREALVRAATEHALAWSFEVARGRLAELALPTLDVEEVVIVAKPGIASKWPSAMRGDALPTEIYVVLDPTPAADRTLSVALELAGGDVGRLVLMGCVEGAEALERLRRRVAAALGRQAEQTVLNPLDAGHWRQLVRPPKRPAGRIAVVSVTCVPPLPGAIDTLLAAVDIPIVLVN